MAASRFCSSPSFGYLDHFCRFLFLFALGLALQRRYFRDVADPFKCNGLLNDGNWLDAGTTNASYRNWQPPGCMMHKYTKSEIEECFGGQRLVFVGDSTSRQIFEAVTEKMGYTLAQLGHVDQGGKIRHENMLLHYGNTTVFFVWDPYLNSTGLQREISTFQYEPSTDKSVAATSLLFLRAPGLWHARYDEDNYLDYFKTNIDQVRPFIKPQYLQQLGSREEPSNLLLLSPVLVPYFPLLTPDRKVTITAERIGKMNEYLHEASEDLPLTWSTTAMSAGSYSQGTHDEFGLHVLKSVAEVQADILLNLRCNSKIAKRGFPYDRTCCMDYKKPATVQWFIIGCGVIAFLILVLRVSGSLVMPNSDAFGGLKAGSIMFVVLCFCYIADRTHIFEVAQKQFSGLEFWASCIATTILGVASIRSTKRSSSNSGRTDDLFLSRDQTDEWKGWMQALILIYHYTGASKLLGIYKAIRLLVSAYLFLTGYGHTLSLIQNGNFSLKKTLAVVLRLNILTVALSYIMDSNYLFYYFPALSTLWYLVIYLVLRIGHKQNQNLSFVCMKIFSFAALTTGFVKIPGIMETISLCLQHMFKIDWDIPEWRFRLSLDLYIVYLGMIFALLRIHHQASEENGVPSAGWNLLRTRQFFSPSRMSTSFATLFCIAYLLISRTFSEKFAYNRVHPYISWMPILGFVILRNSHEVVKNYYSASFAWLGRISLETYILQYHIWLAGDTKGLLRMGVFNRGVEAAILTTVFIWVSWHVSEASKTVVRQLTDVKAPQLDRSRQQEEGYALVPQNNDADEQGSAADENGSIPDEQDEKAQADGRLSILRSKWDGVSYYACKIFGDLRWRLFLMVAALWLANFISDAQARSDS